MSNSYKYEALRILNYWKNIEFLTQQTVLKESIENKKIIKNVRSRREVKSKKLEAFHIFENFDDEFFGINFDDEDYYPGFDSIADEVHYTFGKIERNLCIKKIAELTATNTDKFPDKDESEIAWFGFKTDSNLVYQENSFNISPILFAINQLINNKGKDLNILLSKEHYDSVNKDFEEKFKEKSLMEEPFLLKIYKEIYHEYVVPVLEKNYHPFFGIGVYLRYKNEQEKLNDIETVYNYSTLTSSFFLDDIEFFINEISNNNFGKTSYENKVLEYILALNIEELKKKERVDISPNNQNYQEVYDKIHSILYPSRCPVGKWPSKFSPALMQQIAINLSLRQMDKEEQLTDIMSVNGPPGTGKTTLLKEIIADNIVKRANKISSLSYKDADDFFTEKNFMYGPEKYNNYLKFAPHYYVLKDDEINKYGMLVCSCNNAAVENISKELPNERNLLDSVEPDNDDKENGTAKGLQDIYDLFKLDSNEDEVYFSNQAQRLFEVKSENNGDDKSTEKYWGIIAAPLGKKSNLTNYCYHVICQILFNYKSNESIEEHKEIFKKARRDFKEQYRKVLELRNVIVDNMDHKYMKSIDMEFIRNYFSKDLSLSTKAQLTNPWLTDEYNREREKLFFYACQVHKEFILSSKSVMQNFRNFLHINNLYRDEEDIERIDNRDLEESYTALLQTIFLLTPVLSSTFASVGRFLKNVKPRALGLLIVDEAGQAQPQMAIGALMRCRKAIIVGDPKQIEPVVTDDVAMLQKLYNDDYLTFYKNKNISVQKLADSINKYGTYINEEWVGCPLVVHRRCISPMYDVSNVISYENTMKNQTRNPKPEIENKFLYTKSCWIDIKGSEKGSKNHFVEEQGRLVLEMLKKAWNKNNQTPDLYIITPFTSVRTGMINYIKESDFGMSEKKVIDWCEENIGTVHTFQGKEAKEVIFLLGCDNNAKAAVTWVNSNIVNVAATRAKFRFYIVGDKTVWQLNPVIAKAKEIINENISANEFIDFLNEVKKDEDRICPNCGKKLVIKAGKNGDFYACPGFPSCKYTESISCQTKKTVSEDNELSDNENLLCPECLGKLVKRNGKYGPFYGCSNYPECNYIKSIKKN